MPTENQLLIAALKYHQLGWSIVPILPRSKKALGSWAQYQNERASEAQIREWWQKSPAAGIAVVLGKISGIFAVDIDDENAFAALQKQNIQLDDEPTPLQKTSRGFHYIFAYPEEGLHTQTFDGGEIRSDGAYIILAPSVHPSGHIYQWTLSPFQQNPSYPPKSLLKFCTLIDALKKPVALPPAGDCIPKGQRNNALFRLACSMRRPGMNETEIATALAVINGKRCAPPLPQRDIQKIAQSAAKYQPTARIITPQEYIDQKSILDFPNIMSGLAGDFAKLYSAHLEPPPQFFYIAFLTCLGNLVSSRLTLMSELNVQPRLFTIILGESADDRKSTAVSKTIDFFRHSFEPFAVSYGVGSAEGLQKNLNRSANLLLVFDEFKQFISKCKIDSSVLLPCVNTLFESNYYSNSTKTSDVSIDDAHLSLIAATTIETYDRIWDAAFTAIGFTNRLFLVPGSGKRQFAFPKIIPEDSKKEIKSYLAQILATMSAIHSLAIDTDAQKRYNDWYLSLNQSVYTKRIDTYAMRFMALLAVNDDHTTITLPIVDKVIELMQWQINVRQVHDPIDADNNMAKMEQRILRALNNGALSDRELKQSTHANRSGLWFYNTAKNNLIKYHEIVFNKDKKLELKV